MRLYILDNILSSSISLFLTKGIREVSVRDIVKASDVSIRTFYRYFESKEHVIDYMIKIGLKRDRAELRMVKKQFGNPVEMYVSFINSTYKSVVNMSADYYRDLVKYYPNQFALINEFMNKDITEFYVYMIRKGRKTGLFKKDLNEKLLAIYYSDSVIHSLYELFLHSKVYSKNQVYLEVHRIIMYSLCTPKGLRVFEKSCKDYFPELII